MTMKIEELIQHLPKKARFVAMSGSYAVWFANRPDYFAELGAYNMLGPLDDCGLVQIEIESWADSIKDSLIELPEPVPELKRGDKVRFRDRDDNTWVCGYYVGKSNVNRYPNTAIVAGSKIASEWRYCEPYAWTESELYENAMEVE